MSPVHLPLLRAGRPHASLDRVLLCDVATGEPLARVSQAIPALIARDLGRSAQHRSTLARVSAAELTSACVRAAALFCEAELPLGEDGLESPAQHLARVSATTGLPLTLAWSNLEKLRRVLAGMPAIVAGLTRGLDPRVLDAGWGWEDPWRERGSGRGHPGSRRQRAPSAGVAPPREIGRHGLGSGGWTVAYRPASDALGAVLPSNAPGVHGLWLPAIALKIPLVLRPGAREPWTPWRLIQALLAAGVPPEAASFYPSDHAGAAEILLRCGRSLLFGDAATVRPWAADPRIEIHGPGRSKVILAAEEVERWPAHLDLLADSVAANGGRSCLSVSGIWLAGGGDGAARELAVALAQRLAALRPLPLDHPRAALAALPDLAAAQRLSAYLDAQLAAGGALDVSAGLRGGRIARAGGCVFLLPTVVLLAGPAHPLAEMELPFPFVSVVPAPEGEIPDRLGPTLAATVLGGGPALRARLLACPHLHRLHFGPISTHQVDFTQPHEGNLFEHLYQRRAVTVAGPAG